MKTIFYFLIFLHGFIFAETSQPVLRVLILAETRIESDIATGVKKDIAQMIQSLRVISKKIKYPLDLTVLKDTNFTAQSVKVWLSSLPQSSSDIIFFYYTGHGCCNMSHKPWPALELSDTVIGGYSIVKYIKEHRHRLDIILFDSCNAWSDAEIEQDFKSSNFALSYEKHQPGLRELFLEQKALIIASAAKPGEYSGLVNRGSRRGSIFTNAFLVALKKYSKMNSASWRKLFCLTNEIAIKASEHQQHVIFRIE